MTVKEMLTGEKNDIEYKEDIPPKSEKYVKTAVAFANCGGGRLVFGVEDGTWQVKGFHKEEVFRKMDAVTNAIYDSCEPKIIPNVNIQELEGKYIITADIPDGMQKPYCIRSQGMFDGTYIRVSGTTRKAERYRIQEMILDSGNRSYDQEMVDRELKDEEIEVLCERLYRNALELAPTEEIRQSIKRISKSQLVTYKLIQEKNGMSYATNGYQLLDGKLDNYPDAAVQCAVFKGTVRDIFITRKEFKGNIDGEIESAYAFVLEHINLGARIDGLARQDIYELPTRTIREMIANAVCHRSYLAPGKIQVALFDDRLEVTSPGMLDSELTLEKMKCGQSKIRNRGIAEIFSYMHIIEGWGSGIPKMFEEADAYGLAEPEILDMGSAFRVNLYRREFETDAYGVVEPLNNKTCATNATKPETNETKFAINETKSATNATKSETNETNTSDLTMAEQRILEIIKTDGNIKQKQLSEMADVSLGTVKRLLPKLQEKGLLVRIGNKRSGTWKVTSTNSHSQL